MIRVVAGINRRTRVDCFDIATMFRQALGFPFDPTLR